jgi:hypothetical protein
MGYQKTAAYRRSSRALASIKSRLVASTPNQMQMPCSRSWPSVARPHPWPWSRPVLAGNLRVMVSAKHTSSIEPSEAVNRCVNEIRRRASGE